MILTFSIALLYFRVPMVMMAHEALMVFQAHKVQQVHPDQAVWLDHKVLLVDKEYRVRKVMAESQEKLVDREVKAPKDNKETMVHQ